MNKYEEILAITPEPIDLSEVSQKVDLRGIIAYAKTKGVSVIDLSEEEKQKFVSNR